MADILTLAEARAALGWTPNQHQADDADLEATYIPAVTETIEAWCGRMEDRTETWRTDAASPVTPPWPDTAVIKSVYVDETKLTTYDFTAGVLTISDPSYAAGDKVKITAGNLPVPRAVVEAARIILVQLWNASHQGGDRDRPDPAEPRSVPIGVAIPRRAEVLLNPYWHFGGFA